MKYFPFVFCFAVLLLFPGKNALKAQAPVPETERVVMSPEELKTIIRKMAELRRRRLMLWRQQQARMVRRATVADSSAMNPGQSEAVNFTSTAVRDKADGNAPDTVTSIVEREGARPVKALTSQSQEDRERSGAAERQSPPPSRNMEDDNDGKSAGLAELRRRLDRQEELLLDIRERSFAVQPVSAPAAEPAKTDTIIQRIMRNSRDGDALNKEDLRELTTEVSRMNTEINSLRERLRYEEDRRRRAEVDMQRALDQNTESRYDRDRALARDLAAATAPVEQEAPVRIVRDTVYVDRVRTQPVFIPKEGRTDTVTIIKETIREAPPVVIKDTVLVEREDTIIRDRDVVRTDTVKLEASEPISFPAIFFDNNSSKLNSAHLSLLATTVSQVRNRENYVIRLTGYSSPSGNAAYNRALSAKRAEAVRAGLEKAGFDPARIILVPGGIDYQPTSAAAARRVEVEAIPR